MLDLFWRNLKKIYRSPNSATDGKQTYRGVLGQRISTGGDIFAFLCNGSINQSINQSIFFSLLISYVLSLLHNLLAGY